MDDRPKPQSPTAVRRKLERLEAVLRMIADGLNGKPFAWGDGQRSSWQPMAERLGITLVTATSAKRLGYEVRAGAKPVGSAYFRAPLQRYADLFVLECHCVPIKPPQDHQQPLL